MTPPTVRERRPPASGTRRPSHTRPLECPHPHLPPIARAPPRPRPPGREMPRARRRERRHLCTHVGRPRRRHRPTPTAAAPPRRSRVCAVAIQHGVADGGVRPTPTTLLNHPLRVSARQWRRSDAQRQRGGLHAGACRMPPRAAPARWCGGQGARHGRGGGGGRRARQTPAGGSDTDSAAASAATPVPSTHANDALGPGRGGRASQEKKKKKGRDARQRKHATVHTPR